MVKEKQDQMGMKKKVCPPTLCTAKLAPAADDGLLLVLVGRSNIVVQTFMDGPFFVSLLIRLMDFLVPKYVAFLYVGKLCKS